MLAWGVLEEGRGGLREGAPGLERGREGGGAEQVRRGPVRDAGRAWSRHGQAESPGQSHFEKQGTNFLPESKQAHLLERSPLYLKGASSS